MNRIVVNKHFSNSSAITYNSFGQSTGYVGKGAPALGEIIVCNEAGYEGIYILNTAHQAIRIGAWTGDIEADLERLKREIKEEIEQWAETQFASQSEIDNLQEQIDAIVITPIDEGRVREIANEEISKIVGSATTYNTLYKIEQWIINSGSSAVIDPQLIDDVEQLKSLSAGTRLDTLESISADTRIENLESLSAGTRLDGIESISAETRINALEEKIDGISKSTDHFVMTYQQYQQLIISGSVVVDGETVIYDDDNFYCIYEGEEPTPGPDSGDTTPQYVSGTIITVADQEDSDLENHIIEITYLSFDEDTGLLVLDGGGSDSQEDSKGEVTGDVVTPENSEYSDTEVEIVINDITDDGIVDTNWEISEK